MRTVVSQQTILIDGAPACPRCGRRPRLRIPKTARTLRSQGRQWYGYCDVCRADDERERREGLTRLTAEERALIDELRAVEPAGRHHARA